MHGCSFRGSKSSSFIFGSLLNRGRITRHQVPELQIRSCLFQVNGWSLRGGNSSIFFIFASLLNGGQLLQERICSPRSKFFPSRVDPFWMCFSNQQSKQEVTKVVSLCKNGRKTKECIPIHLNTGLPRSGKNIWKMLGGEFQVREKSENFVIGQGTLERTGKGKSQEIGKLMP